MLGFILHAVAANIVSVAGRLYVSDSRTLDTQLTVWQTTFLFFFLIDVSIASVVSKFFLASEALFFPPGTLAEYAIASASHAVSLPDGLSYDQAARECAHYSPT